jgi:hypothetical protein
MVNRLTAAALVFSVGCGAILNGSSSTIVPPPGATVDGQPTPIVASNQTAHEIVYPDGRRCIVGSHISAGYLVADVVLWFLVGIIIDGVSGDWNVLDEGACPGVQIQ